MSNDDSMRQMQTRISALTDENAELKVILLDAFVALSNSTPRPGAEQYYDQIINRLILKLGLSDDEISSLLG